MKKISEKQNDTEKKFSKQIKITDEEMRRNYNKFLVMAFFGFELVIINLIFLIMSYIMFFLLIPLGILIGAYGLYGIYLHKRKPEKLSKKIKITDEEMRRNYDKFLLIAFLGFASIIINLTVLFLQLIAIFFLIPLGILIGAYGLYGINLHKRKPEKYREMLERKKIFTKEIKITDEEMKRNYNKFFIMAIFGFVLVIIYLVFSMIYLLILGIAIGAYGLYGIYLHERKPQKYREILERKKSRRKYIELLKKRSKIIFMVGTIIIGFTIPVIWLDLVFFPRGGWRGLLSMVIAPVYFFGLLLVVYSIHLIGNKWGWLVFPIAIVMYIIAIFQYTYRLAWFLAFPLNYLALLILFLVSINKKKLSKEIKITDKIRERKVLIGIIGFCGFLNIIIGLLTLIGAGLWGTISFRIFIGITFIPSGILAIVGALVEFKSLLIGSFLCLLAGIFSIVIPLIVNYYTFYALKFYALIIYIPTFVIIVGGILGILKYKKMK